MLPQLLPTKFSKIKLGDGKLYINYGTENQKVIAAVKDAEITIKKSFFQRLKIFLKRGKI